MNTSTFKPDTVTHTVDTFSPPPVQAHLGMWMSSRLPQCSTCSPGKPGAALDSPDCHFRAAGNGQNTTGPFYDWCFAHIYDPEGEVQIPV